MKRAYPRAAKLRTVHAMRRQAKGQAKGQAEAEAAPPGRLLQPCPVCDRYHAFVGPMGECPACGKESCYMHRCEL